MVVSKKCHYALRAIFELSMRNSSEPVKVNKIADAQNIPPRFLELILNQLKHAGYVESRRGKEGGYILCCDPGELTVGEIIEAVHGPIDHNDREIKSGYSGYLRGDYAFSQLWDSIHSAVSTIYRNTKFADLIQLERAGSKSFVVNYAI
jgi:Rrf2 family protein